MQNQTELRPTTLEDKYEKLDEPCLISGPQALVRMVIAQKRRDEYVGLNTAGFVSGYRGSPLGYVDQTMWDAEKWLKVNKIIFQPGINEDLAATAVWGTQQLKAIKNVTVDGVFSLWYGKGPGVDRSGDAFKHGNYSGTHPQGGVLVLLGDDHPGKSSTVAHHSEQAMVAHQMPVIYPASVHEYVKFGLLGWALSRYAGCWTAFKVVNESIEQTATIDGEFNFEIVEPEKGELPPEGLYYRGVFSIARDEVIHKRYRLPLAQKFCRANKIDRVEFSSNRKKLGLVTAGKSYGDVLQALRYLGIDRTVANQIGLDVYKVGMIWPLEPEGMREFASGFEELFFIEEKMAFLESQASALLYNDNKRPVIVGKSDEKGKFLLASDGLLEPLVIADAIAARLNQLGLLTQDIERRLQIVKSLQEFLKGHQDPLSPKRLPFFCSGCPHNTSTNVPDGSVAMSGIGCHGMAMWAKPSKTILGTHMGAEGVTWASLQHFTETKHIFQNIGDGTYYHSGLLAIRQSIAAKSNITYKILYNDAVAMTGGQPVDGPITPAGIARQMLAEGVQRVVIVAEDPSRHDLKSVPVDVTVYPRAELDNVQRVLRDIPGCTVLIYDQVCAAEKRRRRKRKIMEDPLTRVVINPEVCEGCGDCSTKSSCVSIEPLETVLGRKRKINQSSCNRDLSCSNGFCPSFITLLGVKPKKGEMANIDPTIFEQIPDQNVMPVSSLGYGVMLAGIGGTGVVTVGSVLAMAAHLDGLQSSAYDMTGIAQKNGAVLSHVRFGRNEDGPIPVQSIGVGEAQLVIGFDMVASLSDECFRTISSATKFIGNQHLQPTAAFTSAPDERLDFDAIEPVISKRVGRDNAFYMDATEIALSLCGDSIGTNFFMIGVAYQSGFFPVSKKAILHAIELNGVQVSFNINAFNLGRLWVYNRAAINNILKEARTTLSESSKIPVTVEEIVDDRCSRLVSYQNQAYADRYKLSISKILSIDEKINGKDRRLSEAAAKTLFRLMAYKDEYEVARLHLDPNFRKQILKDFEGNIKIRYNLAPPLIARRDKNTGHLIKSSYGSWVVVLFKILAPLKIVRGSIFDVFGYTEERRTERAMIVKYEKMLEEIADTLTADNYELALARVNAPIQIRGYGHVKEQSIAKVNADLDKLSKQYYSAGKIKSIPIVSQL
jgi:indolepyruvate ferredoxin oxidoreductase